MRINREQLLAELKSVMAGLSTSKVKDQTDYFIFQDGKVYTRNKDEIVCSRNTLLNITGAIKAKPLVSILSKMNERNIEISFNKDLLLIKGKRERSEFVVKEIMFPVNVESRKKWQKLPDNFAEAISLVLPCASSYHHIPCIHITPKFIEATDDEQAARFKIKTKVSESRLIKRDNFQYIILSDMSKFCETEDWIHFKNSDGLVLSCRLIVSEYPDLSNVFKMKGQILVIPKDLKEDIETAERLAEDKELQINIEHKKFIVIGKGKFGSFKITKEVRYEGKPLRFTIGVQIISEISQEHSKCTISSDRLKVESENFVRIVAIRKVEK